MSARQVRRFQLERLVDVSGVSGTGVVAYGAQAPDGTCVLWWESALESIGIYPDMETLLAIHGHQGTTQAMYIDDPVDAVDPAGRVARPSKTSKRRGATAAARRAVPSLPSVPSVPGGRGSAGTRGDAGPTPGVGARVQVRGRKHAAGGPAGSMV
jgi:hypothetical protein